MACRFGYIDKAKDFFMESLKLDLQDTHGNTKDGLHMANLAGSCLGIINGFAGYRIKESGISISPVVPNGMDGYSFRVYYQGSQLEIEGRKHIQIKLLQGKPINIKIYDKNHLVENTLAVERKQ